MRDLLPCATFSTCATLSGKAVDVTRRFGRSSWPERSVSRCSQVASRTTAPGRLETSTSTPYTMAVENPWLADNPAAAKAHAVTPSRGPQPPMLVGRPMASSASSAMGSIRSGDSVVPAVRAATRNITTWPATTSDGCRHDGRARREGRAGRLGCRCARYAGRGPIESSHRAEESESAVRRRSRPARPPPRRRAWTSVPATAGPASNTTASAAWTTWPAERSQATARRPRLTSSTCRPWWSPRCTSPSTPPGRTVLRNCDR